MAGPELVAGSDDTETCAQEDVLVESTNMVSMVSHVLIT